MILYAFIAVLCVSALSLLGAVFFVVRRDVLNRFMPVLLSISSGVLLGTVFFDLLPEAMEVLPHEAYFYTVMSIAVFFSIEKLMNWHHHADCEQEDTHHHLHTLGYLSLIGDGIHNFIDGIMIGGAFLVSIPLGISMTIGVVAHEIPHELADFMILLQAGFSNKKALFYNFLSALTAVVGAMLAILLVGHTGKLASYLIPIGAGNFLYIAMSDLIPELHKETSRWYSLFQILGLVAGIIAMALFAAE
jgi:zinc and cadmium transporter